MYFEGVGFEEVFRVSANELFYNGDVSKPRDKEINELLNVNLCIRNPRKRLAYFEGRKQGFNLCHAIVESLMLVRKENSLSYFSKFNENMINFSDDKYTLHGCYGKRLYGGINYVIGKLKSDPDTRQAVLNIYSYALDCESTKDVPCTETLQFFIREGKLHMIVNMRSNDVIWGLPYDVFMFTSLQEVIANTLGVGLGCYYHNAGSFHVYQEFYEILENMLVKESKSIVCDALSNINLDQYKDMARRYTRFIDHLEDSVNSDYNEGYLKVLEKECEYRNMKEAVTKMNNVDMKNEIWADDFTKRWYK